MAQDKELMSFDRWITILRYDSTLDIEHDEVMEFMRITKILRNFYNKHTARELLSKKKTDGIISIDEAWVYRHLWERIKDYNLAMENGTPGNKKKYFTASEIAIMTSLGETKTRNILGKLHKFGVIRLDSTAISKGKKAMKFTIDNPIKRLQDAITMKKILLDNDIELPR